MYIYIYMYDICMKSQHMWCQYYYVIALGTHWHIMTYFRRTCSRHNLNVYAQVDMHVVCFFFCPRSKSWRAHGHTRTIVDILAALVSACNELEFQGPRWWRGSSLPNILRPFGGSMPLGWFVAGSVVDEWWMMELHTWIFMDISYPLISIFSFAPDVVGTDEPKCVVVFFGVVAQKNMKQL